MGTSAKARPRGFAVARGWEGRGVRLPQRQTAGSAGYDLEAAETVRIESGRTAVVPTGIKAWMPADEFLGIYIRSSLAFRYGVMLVNSVGIIDSDYYGNASNDGHIQVGLINLGPKPFTLQKGERFAQAIFQPFRRAEEEATDLPALRQGGVGSTGITGSTGSTGITNRTGSTGLGAGGGSGGQATIGGDEIESAPDGARSAVGPVAGRSADSGAEGDNRLSFLGYPVRVLESSQRRRTSTGRWEGNCLVIELAHPLSAAERQRHQENLALRLLAGRRLPALRQRIWRLAAERFADLDLKVGEIHFRQQNRRWGSCSARGNISLSYRLLSAPDELLDYVCIHELSHLVEFNHSDRFWAIVARADPEYRLHREALKEWGQTWQERWERRWQPVATTAAATAAATPRSSSGRE